MGKKQKIIAIYAVVGLLFGIQQWLWGDMAYKGLMYNMGRGLVWPVLMFPAFGQIVAGIIIVLVSYA